MAGIKKYAKKAGKAVEKKVFGSKGFKGRYGIGKGKGGFNFMQVAKDLAMVKSRLNVEKKSVDDDVFDDYVGQVDINADGAYYRDITPQIAQGIAENQRIGNSLKITGLHMPIDILGGAYCLSERRFRFTILKVRSADLGVSAQEAFQKVWDVNPLTLVRDYNAPRAYRNSSNDGISVVYSKTRYMKAPHLDNGSQGADPVERARLSHTINLKLQDLLRYDSNLSALPGGFKYILVVQMDAGNRNLGTVSTADVPITAVSSGAYMRVFCRWWFVDN